MASEGTENGQIPLLLIHRRVAVGAQLGELRRLLRQARLFRLCAGVAAQAG
jgi:hypothetical protein